MKLHQFTVYGGHKEKDGQNSWPHYLRMKIPRSVQLEIIRFLATSLQDEKMTEATINFVGENEDLGEKSMEELFGPVDNAGK